MGMGATLCARFAAESAILTRFYTWGVHAKPALRRERAQGRRYHSAPASRSSQAVSARWSMGNQAETQRSFTPPRQYSTAT